MLWETRQRTFSSAAALSRIINSRREASICRSSPYICRSSPDCSSKVIISSLFFLSASMTSYLVGR
jgi:hypothetical protein